MLSDDNYKETKLKFFSKFSTFFQKTGITFSTYSHLIFGSTTKLFSQMLKLAIYLKAILKKLVLICDSNLEIFCINSSGWKICKVNNKYLKKKVPVKKLAIKHTAIAPSHLIWNSDRATISFTINFKNKYCVIRGIIDAEAINR
ncbi:hypothetical protein BpHYR1_013421 [Brachionus plicatilis]|uniref:Uncharacterized protein n=1 Tax=Brachionus plicatilis TaxID=10195 RepID=A0A3M7Q156_BRAPC|nr:hypothetical protein BpHYR1_013421 [Brachionus plicatilis]